MPTALLVLLIVLAVAGGLYVGHLAGQQRPLEGSKPRKSLGERARNAATQGALSVWRWNRARKKKGRTEGRERDRG
jgi:hypothetical protein